MFWGQSEAIDLYNEYKTIVLQTDKDPESSIKPEVGNKNEINILLFGANDPRHVMKTISKLYTHRQKGSIPILNFYIVEACVEIIARDIALLGIALDNSKDISLRNKVHIFMDVYGNSLLRATTYQYLVDKAKFLISMVADSEYLMKMAPMISIDNLKYRERDGIQNAFNFWLPKDECVFEIQKYWSDKIRKLLGMRYDYREGQFDWDLNMVLKDRGCSQICSQEYRYWRECGIAFTFPEFEYSKPNKTLSAGIIRNGNKYVHRGYIGDIQNGPYAAFGLHTTDQSMMKSFHGENDYRSTDITERNLLEIFHELGTQSPYTHDLSCSRKYGAVRLQMGKRLMHEENHELEAKAHEEPWLNFDGIKINFVSVDDVFSIQESTNTKYFDFFDFAFVGHTFFPLLKKSFINTLRSDSGLLLETKLHTTEQKTIVTDFENNLIKFAKDCNLDFAINYNALNSKNAVLKFRKHTAPKE